MSATDHDVLRRRSTGPWFGVAAAPSAWILQGLLGWWLGAGICDRWSVGLVRTSLAMVGLLALALALAGMRSSLSRWRDASRAERALDEPRTFFMFGGIFVSSAFSVGILWATLNALLITACGETR